MQPSWHLNGFAAKRVSATRVLALVRPDRLVSVNSKSHAGPAVRGLPARAPQQVARRGEEAAQRALPRHILAGDERYFPGLRSKGGNHQPSEPGSTGPGSPSSISSKASTSTPSRASTRCWCWACVDCGNTFFCNGGVSIDSLLRGMVSSRGTRQESDHLCQGYEGTAKGRRKHRFCLDSFEPLGANFSNGCVGGRAKASGPLPAWTAGRYAGCRHPRVRLEWALPVTIDVRPSAGPTCAPE